MELKLQHYLFSVTPEAVKKSLNLWTFWKSMKHLDPTLYLKCYFKADPCLDLWICFYGIIQLDFQWMLKLSLNALHSPTKYSFNEKYNGTPSNLPECFLYVRTFLLFFCSHSLFLFFKSNLHLSGVQGHSWK